MSNMDLMDSPVPVFNYPAMITANAATTTTLSPTLQPSRPPLPSPLPSGKGTPEEIAIIGDAFPALWYRLRVFIYDLYHRNTTSASNDRLAQVIDSSFPGYPYFTPNESALLQAIHVKNSSMSRGTLIAETLHVMEAKRKEWQGLVRVCDPASVFLKFFGISEGDLKRDKLFMAELKSTIVMSTTNLIDSPNPVFDKFPPLLAVNAATTTVSLSLPLPTPSPPAGQGILHETDNIRYYSPSLWYRLRVSIYDLYYNESNHISHSRVDHLSYRTYIGPPYFINKYATKLKSMRVAHSELTLGDLVKDLKTKRDDRGRILIEMSDEKVEPEAGVSQKNGEVETKILGRTISEWADSPAPDRAMIADHIYWTWYGKTYPKPVPQKQDVFETPSKRWWIETPQELQANDPGYLCETCRHIDFEYLINSPVVQLLEEIPLNSLAYVLENAKCAFCRVVASTLRDVFGRPDIDTAVAGEPVLCSMRTLPIETDIRGPRQILLFTVPPPSRVDRVSSIYSLTPKAGAPVSSHNPVTMPQINFELVKKWYNDCNNGICGLNPSRSCGREMPKNFRLIDVDLNCIVHSVQKPRYVALSYVWGGARTLQNTKITRKELAVEGSLLTRAKDLPNTIKDAISLTKNLGEQYLWVDSLCVTQDDPNDQAQQIAAMDLIYSSAVLTVAAASGDSADAHLAGMPSNPRQFRQHVEHIQGIYLANRPADFADSIDKSIWDSRAWTLQERLLSARVLFIGKQRCFFSCQHRQDVFVESDDLVESGLDRKFMPKVFQDYVPMMMQSSGCVNVSSYRRVVKAYTSRQLTFASDILNAFEGIATGFRPVFRSDFVFGLPQSEIDSQLLWQPSGPLSRRRDHKNGQPIFPSWTWAGWVGPVNCNIDENLSRIQWIESDGQRFSGKDFRYPKGANQEATKRQEYRARWKGSLEDDVPYYWERDNPRLWFFHPTAQEEQRTLGPNLKGATNHLVFEAETAEFNPSTIDNDHYWPISIYDHRCTKDKHIMCPLGLATSPGKVGGYVLVPAEISTTLKRDCLNSPYALVMISRCRNPDQKSRGEGNPDLLVDAEATTMGEQCFPDRPHIDTGGGHFDQQRYDGEKPWCMYNIMLVEWVNGVAYRLGVGKMHIDAWAQAEATRKIITLG
ncbi:MAG: hypothetical protein Q9218_003924 [Villophora microphyllina]